ncbi:MAG: dTDP-4-dehydrorhamnose 3,5-epimerase [Elusimicrobiota bacterium]|jgi:dTDP-4-dehydrorhamnose 3,5-epimerase|nr:dTDP-4-dehydrorhamnose 3,5-epimerase [Elusimicrobiota bacterium]
MPFEFEKLEIPDVILIKAKKFEDSRGFFAELYKEDVFSQAGIAPIKQINFSKSSKGVLRGLHFQLNPYAQGKIVRVVSGKIFDVAVDLRKNSKTFGQWVGVCLEREVFNMLYVPEGFAHGFEVLSDIVEFEYLCTQVYAPKYESGIIYNDPSLNIAWNTKNPILSDKDLKLPSFSKNEKYF